MEESLKGPGFVRKSSKKRPKKECCEKSSFSEDDKTAMGIWRTNNFALGRSSPKTDNGIFDTLSRYKSTKIFLRIGRF